MCGGWVDYDYKFTKKCFSLPLDKLYELKQEILIDWRKYIIASSHVKRDQQSLVIANIDPEEWYTGPLEMINWAIENYYLPIEQWDHQYYVWHLLYENCLNFQERLENIKNTICEPDYKISNIQKITLLKETFPEFDFSNSRTVFTKEKRTLKNLPTVKIRSFYYNPSLKTIYDERPILFSKLSIEKRRYLIYQLTMNIIENAATRTFQ